MQEVVVVTLPPRAFSTRRCNGPRYCHVTALSALLKTLLLIDRVYFFLTGHVVKGKSKHDLNEGDLESRGGPAPFTRDEGGGGGSHGLGAPTCPMRSLSQFSVVLQPCLQVGWCRSSRARAFFSGVAVGAPTQFPRGLCAARLATFWQSAGSLPFSPRNAKREAKREAMKHWQAWAGNQTSSRSLVGSLVCAAGRSGGQNGI